MEVDYRFFTAITLSSGIAIDQLVHRIDPRLRRHLVDRHRDVGLLLIDLVLLQVEILSVARPARRCPSSR